MRYEGSSITHEGEHLKGPLVYFVATVGDYTDNDLLPSFGSPHLRTIATTQMCDVLDDSSHPDETDESGTERWVTARLTHSWSG